MCKTSPNSKGCPCCCGTAASQLSPSASASASFGWRRRAADGVSRAEQCFASVLSRCLECPCFNPSSVASPTTRALSSTGRQEGDRGDLCGNVVASAHHGSINRIMQVLIFVYLLWLMRWIIDSRAHVLQNARKIEQLVADEKHTNEEVDRLLRSLQTEKRL